MSEVGRYAFINKCSVDIKEDSIDISLEPLLDQVEPGLTLNDKQMLTTSMSRG